MSKLIGPIKSWCNTFHANIFLNSRNWPSVATQAAPTSPSKASSIYVKLLKLLALIFVFFLLILAFFTLWWRHLSEAVHNGNNAFLKLHYRYMDYVRQNEIQGCNMVFFKAHAYGISFCLTWSIDLTHSTWQIQLWCPRSKWNMGEIKI